MKTAVYLLIAAVYAAPHASHSVAMFASFGFLVVAVAVHFSDKGTKP